MKRILIVAAAVAMLSCAATAQSFGPVYFLPTIIPAATTPAPVTISAYGSGFVIGVSQVYANGLPMPTTVTSVTDLTFQISNVVPQMAVGGGVTITVVNPPGPASKSLPLIIEVSPGVAGANIGTLLFLPPGHTPGQSIRLLIDGLAPYVPFTLMADTVIPPPAYNVPSGTALILGVNPVAPSFFPILDGLGLFGPPNPQGVTQLTPLGSPVGGGYLSPPFTTPNPSSGVSMSLQAVHVDPTSFLGWSFTWTLFPFTL